MAKKNTKKRKSAKKKTQKDGTFFGWLVKWTFVTGLWAGIALALLIAWYAVELPSITQAADFKPKTSITVKAADGSIIARYGEIRGNSVTVDQLPPHLVHAVMAIEDRRFYSHFGIDLLGIARAMVTNLRHGRVSQGGSTITQQLAKNLFLSKERTLKRKIQEAVLALWLEHELTKDEIMSAYLNRVYLGAGTFGVDAAARLYFGKPAKDVNLREAALLAGLLKAPSRYSPTNNPMLAEKRTEVVINAMADAGYISEEEAEGMTNAPPRPTKKPSSADAIRYYTDWVVDGLEDLIGTPEKNIIVETTMNPTIQRAAEEALGKALLENGEERKISQGAVVVMRPNGMVVAMVGGRDYASSQFNRAVQAKRQPGSSFKPVVYLTALENGWRATDLVIDEPITTGRYRPANFGGKYYGEVMLIDALTLSLNTISYQLIKELGPEAVIDTARRLGIYSPLEPNLSIGLGSSGISLLEMTTAYSVLANGGLAVFPYAITKITDEDGELYYQRPHARTTRRVVDYSDINELTYMMQSVIQNGTGQRAKLPWPAAGKTGTSQDSRDGWFMGFTDELVAGVWMGNDDNSPMKAVTGGSYPAGIWQEVMAKSRGKYAPVRSSDFSFGTFQDLLSRIIPTQRTQVNWNQDRRNTRNDNRPPARFDHGYDFGDDEAHEKKARYND